VERETLTSFKPVLTPERLATHLAAFQAGPRERLMAAFQTQSFAGKLEAEIVAGLGMNVPDVMLRLLPLARLYALADFHVGAIAQGTTGAFYFGANMEIPRAPLGWTIHAEQSSVLGALAHGERSISRLAVTSAPCGHCRQFLNELGTSSELQVLLADEKPFTLAELLPHAFGPAELGVSTALLSHADWKVRPVAAASSALSLAALDALRRSYAPYTCSPAAVALETWNGLVVAAPYVENAAYNPSVPPVLAALDRLRFHNATAADVRAAVLVELEESRIEHASNSRAIMKAAGSEVELTVLKGRPANN
jgi:cytidine deaminase